MERPAQQFARPEGFTDLYYRFNKFASGQVPIVFVAPERERIAYLSNLTIKQAEKHQDEMRRIYAKFTRWQRSQDSK